MHFNGLKTALLLGLMSAIIVGIGAAFRSPVILSLIHISEPTRPY